MESTATGATTAPTLSIGYALSTEEHRPADLVRFARMAEETGFAYASISDHFHPWLDSQGNSPFAWTVLGGIAEATERLFVGTGVTCPTDRYHPAVIAQAAATVAAMMPGRFFLGVGTGEYLNEHIIAERWAPYELRAAKLEEAVSIIRALWTGDWVTHRGEHFVVENARLYTLPAEPPPIVVAASGPESADLAARIGDGLMNYAPDASIVERFRAAKPNASRYLQVNVCWAEDEAEARRTAHRICPNVALKGELGNLLPMPAHYQQAVEMVTEDDVAEAIVCGPDPERHVEAIEQAAAAGFDHVHIYQVGPDQEGFFRFYERNVLPRFATA